MFWVYPAHYAWVKAILNAVLRHFCALFGIVPGPVFPVRSILTQVYS